MPKREIIEGRPVLLVIDIQGDACKEERSGDIPGADAIPHMDGAAARALKTRELIDAAREVQIPIVFMKEAHRPDHVDFGRELDGAEDVHLIETWPGNDVAPEMGVRETDYVIAKRRYSSFFGTDLEILLKGLKADTLVLTGALTDVCVHYTFVDAHQHDYFCRVVEDCVYGSSDKAHEAALEAMEYLQTGARRTLAEMKDAFSAYGAGAVRKAS